MLMLRSKFKGLRTLKDIEPALDVCIDIRIGRGVRVWNCDSGGEVKDHGASLNSVLDAVGIADVTGEDLQVLFDVIFTAIQPAPRVSGWTVFGRRSWISSFTAHRDSLWKHNEMVMFRN